MKTQLLDALGTERQGLGGEPTEVYPHVDGCTPTHSAVTFLSKTKSKLPEVR